MPVHSGDVFHIQVLPGTIEPSSIWHWASLSRTIMRRGVAPDHVTRMTLLTVLASLAVNLGTRDKRQNESKKAIAL